MDRQLLLGLVISAAAIAAGFAFQDQHYRLDVPGLESDQRVIAHRDSPYTGMTWVASPGKNYLQLRFFEMVEGGVCLEPTWAQLAADGRLPHLKPASLPALAPGQVDPGTLNNSAYISFFPAGLLLNRSVPAAPQVLVVGLGSGVGIAQILHHFPKATVEVVDIDPAVIEMVREHYPLLAWAEKQGRVVFAARDARAHVRARKGHGFNMVILDAYTAGSTIPPHLMTREFFAECADTLADGGTVFANIIGCYGEQVEGGWRGAKRRVVGGALRTFRAAGLEHAWVIPVLHGNDRPAAFDRTSSRNNIIIAAQHPISPRRFAEGWTRLRDWTPFPELEVGRHVSRQYQVIDSEANTGSTYAPAAWIDPSLPHLSGALRQIPLGDGAPGHTHGAVSDDRALIESAMAAVRGNAPPGSQLRGWRDAPAKAQLYLRTVDWVLFPRETWRTSIAFGRDVNKHDPDLLVGPVDGPEREAAPQTWHMTDAPLFTDLTPNADIVNR
jgi:SAM-dependent methyltransferase